MGRTNEIEGASMAPANDQRFWARIIDSVRSFYTLCALIVLVIGSAFAATILRASSFESFIALLVTCLVILAAGLYYFVTVDRSELTFRLRVSKSTTEGPLPMNELKVALFKNGKRIKERLTDDSGEVAFTVRLTRADELYVEISHPNGARKSPLYAEGQCQFVKSIML